MKIIDDQLISDVVEQAKQSPRLRMNYNFHESLEDKCHRFLNALEPGTFIPANHPGRAAQCYLHWLYRNARLLQGSEHPGGLWRLH